MKAIFINNVHPGTPHVSGMRMRYFAEAMSRRGHRIVLLTPTLHDSDPAVETSEIADMARAHDWQRPLHITFRPAQSATLKLLRKGGVPPLVRRMMTATLIVTTGGVHPDRVAGSKAYWQPLSDAFAPDLIWAIFGDTSNLELARRLARASSALFVTDLQDNWENYVRPILRKQLAHRFRSAAAFTSNAEFHANIAARWHRQRHRVIYSGVAADMIATFGSSPDPKAFRLTLVGSTYDRSSLSRFLAALQSWLGTLPLAQQSLIELAYAGGDTKEMQQGLLDVPLSCHVVVSPYLLLSDLGRLCQSAAVNCYIWAPFGFHHKLLELIACRRPVISFPGEHEESKRLAHEVGGVLLACSDEEALVAAFDRAFRRWQAGDGVVTTVDTAAFSWDAMAEKLEEFMNRTLENSAAVALNC